MYLGRVTSSNAPPSSSYRESMMVNDDDDDDDNASCFYLQATVSTYLPTLSYLGHLIRHLPSSSQHVCS